MTTLTNKKRNSSFFNMALVSVLSIIILTGFGFALRGRSGIVEVVEETATSTLPSSSANEKMSPAAAYSNGRATLFFYTPVEMCQIMYCPQAQLLQADLQKAFGAQLNFVPVNVNALTGDNIDQAGISAALDNWDLYPVGDIAEWLPQMEETQFGTGLNAPTIVLVDVDGNVQYKGSQNMTASSLETHITQLLGR
ncbi:MAG: hypothetical protein GWP61_27845 [Chloroflexi bacterium]|jgi:hypothetical protein|nr:hypothetical protein [Chloroflexota bacterium]